MSPVYFPVTEGFVIPVLDKTPQPHSVSIGFTQHCRTCQPFWGHPHAGWCRYHELFVDGLHNCPDWELRQAEEWPDNGDEKTEKGDSTNSLLQKLVSRGNNLRSQRSKRRRRTR